MIFEALDKIKRNAIFSAILLVALGVLILICPRTYSQTLLLGFGYTLTVLAVVMVLLFLTSKKSLMDYVKFVGAVALGIGGICILVFREEHTLRVLAFSFGMLLILDGLRTLIHSFTFARRSGRKGWWVLTILSALLIGLGIMLFSAPMYANEDTLLTMVGLTLLFAAIVSGVRLIWTWPVKKNSKEVTQDAQAK